MLMGRCAADLAERGAMRRDRVVVAIAHEEGREQLDALLDAGVRVVAVIASADLVDRIDRHAFDRVVLFARGGALTVDVDDPAWRTLHFSVPIIGALARSYRAERIVGPYLLLVPQSHPAERSE